MIIIGWLILLVNDDDSNDYQISLWLSTHYFTMLFISDVISTWLSSEDGWWKDGWTMDELWMMRNQSEWFSFRQLLVVVDGWNGMRMSGCEWMGNNIVVIYIYMYIYVYICIYVYIYICCRDHVDDVSSWAGAGRILDWQSARNMVVFYGWQVSGNSYWSKLGCIWMNRHKHVYCR